MPSLSDVVVNPIATSGDNFDARLESKIADVLGGPIRVLVERIDDGTPGVERHDPVEHLGQIDLDDEAIEDRGVFGLGIFNNLGEFFFDVGAVGVFRIGDEVDVRVFNHEIDHLAIIHGMELTIVKGGKEVFGGEI